MSIDGKKRFRRTPGNNIRDWEHTPDSGGMLSWSRINCHSWSLFGSKVKHNEVIQVTLTRGEESRALASDYHFGGSELIAQVHMSPLQFADFISTPNRGSGIPCTIEYERTGKMRKNERPEFVSEGERMEDDFKQDLLGLKKQMASIQRKAEELAEGHKFNKTERREMAEALRRAHAVLTDHLPFMLDRFVDSMDRVSTEAKKGVDAYIDRRINDHGLEALRAEVQGSTPQLPEIKDNGSVSEED